MSKPFHATAVVNNVMYATTPVVDNKMKILAIRANSGDIIWESPFRILLALFHT
jgi:hypothetical protein